MTKCAAMSIPEERQENPRRPALGCRLSWSPSPGTVACAPFRRNDGPNETGIYKISASKLKRDPELHGFTQKLPHWRTFAGTRLCQGWGPWTGPGQALLTLTRMRRRLPTEGRADTGPSPQTGKATLRSSSWRPLPCWHRRRQPHHRHLKTNT